jgi:glucuronate isomerase
VRGKEVKERLLTSGYVLKDVAAAMGIIPQNLQSLLGVDDIKTGVLENIAKAINKSIYFFYEASTSSDHTLNSPSIIEYGNNVHEDYKEKYFELLEENRVLHNKYEALLEQKKGSAAIQGGAAGVKVG